MNEKNKALPNSQHSERAIINEQYKDKDIQSLLKDELQAKAKQAEENQIPFPVSVLPEPLSSFVREVSEVYSVPPEFPACAVLCAVSASVQKKIHLHNGKYINYPQLWLMLVAPPGVGKSEPLSLAFRKLTEWDKTSYEKYQEQMDNWKTECATARKDKSAEPTKPTYRQYLINDFTPESLYSTMFQNEYSITLFRDELSGWFSDFGRYNKNGEIQHYLSMFTNKDFKITRKTQEPQLISKPFISVAGSIQPEVLASALKNQSLIENGFASRFLFAYPKDIKKPHYSDKQVNQEVIGRYETLIEHLIKHIPHIDKSVELSIEAKKLYVNFVNAMTDKSNSTNENHIKAIYAKMEIHLLRIALILHIVEGVYNDELWMTYKIQAHTMQNAIEITKYFIRISLMLNDQNQISNFNLSDAIRLIEKEKGIVNKQAFADSIGVTRQYISKLCNQQ